MLGSRNAGITYKLINIQSTSVAAVVNPLIQVGTWKSTTGFNTCNSTSSGCSTTIIYQSGVTVVPNDTKAPKYIILNKSTKTLMYALAAIIFALLIAIIIYFIINRTNKLVSQPEFISLIMLGQLFGAIKILIIGLEITTSSCQFGLWMGHLSYLFIISSLYTKTYKVSLFLEIGKTGEGFVVWSRFAAIMIIGFVLIIILMMVGQPHYSYIASISNNQESRILRCAYYYSNMTIIIFTLEGFGLLWVARLCWNIREIPDASHESKHIASSKYPSALYSITSSLLFCFLFI